MSPSTLERAVHLLSCMAHPVRLSVLSRLHDGGPAHVGALCAALEVEQSALSHHLRLLRDARLVVGERAGDGSSTASKMNMWAASCKTP